MDEHQQQTDVGTVVAVNGERVSVEVQRSAGCGSCAMRGLCFGRNTPARFEIESELELHLGDKVELDIAPGGRVLSALAVFGLPLVFLFAAYFLAAIWLEEPATIGVAFAATVLSFLIIRLIDRGLGGRLRVRIARRL